MLVIENRRIERYLVEGSIQPRVSLTSFRATATKCVQFYEHGITASFGAFSLELLALCRE